MASLRTSSPPTVSRTTQYHNVITTFEVVALSLDTICLSTHHHRTARVGAVGGMCTYRHISKSRATVTNECVKSANDNIEYLNGPNEMHTTSVHDQVENRQLRTKDRIVRRSVVIVFMQPALRQEWSWMCLHGPQCAFEMSMFKCVLQLTL